MHALEDKGVTGKIDVVNGRFIKPLDTKLLSSLQGNVITIEDNVLSGGFGAAVEREIAAEDEGKTPETRRIFRAFGYKDMFIPQGGVASLQRQYGVSCEEIQTYLEGILK